jgi:hypothetical protein
MSHVALDFAQWSTIIYPGDCPTLLTHCSAHARCGRGVEREPGLYQDNAIVLARLAYGDTAITDILAHSLRITLERIAIATAARGIDVEPFAWM